MTSSEYRKPEVERFGTFRELTQLSFPFGSFGANDLPGFSSQGPGGSDGGNSAETGDPGGRS